MSHGGDAVEDGGDGGEPCNKGRLQLGTTLQGQAGGGQDTGGKGDRRPEVTGMFCGQCPCAPLEHAATEQQNGAAAKAPPVN